MEKYDVVIVGGGPGGSMAAKTAAEAGLKTIFFERGRRPGEKNSSGCGLGQRWWRDFPEIVEKVTKLPSYRKITMCLVNIIDENNNLRARISTGGSDVDRARYVYGGRNRGMDGSSVLRMDLDPMLADMATEAGAELRTSTLVTDVIKKNGRVAGVITDKGEKIEAEVVIGADGAMSTMARKSGLRNRWKAGVTLCPQLHFSCSESKLDDVVGEAEWLWFGPFYGTFQVHFRAGFHLGVGNWLRRWDAKPIDMLKRVLEIPAFQAVVRATEAKPIEYQAHMLPWMEKPPQTYTDGLMLVGDAAGYPCPLEGEGIWHACYSARIAAEVAKDAISKGDTSAETLEEYEKRCRESLLGLEHKFGAEFVTLWENSVFDPERMKQLIQLLLELQMLHPFSFMFDWGGAHMENLNQHLGHVLDMLPEFSEFGRRYLLPLLFGISPENLGRILNLMKPMLPMAKALGGL